MVSSRRCRDRASWAWVALLLAAPTGVSAGENPAAVQTAPRRRLFGISWPPPGLPDPGQIVEDTTDFVEDTGNHLGDAVSGSFDFVRANFQEATRLIEDGHQVVAAAFDATGEFGSQMETIYEEFRPLENVFASSHGLIPLLTNEERLSTLTSVLLRLVRTTADVEQIGEAIGSVGGVFNDLNGLFSRELASLNPVGGRRLQDFTSLLDGLNFDQITASMNHFSDQAQEYGSTLGNIRDTLEPLLGRLQEHLEGRRLLRENHTSEVGRRLVIDQDELERDQWRYEGAVRGVVPTWQSVEGMVREACGTTEEALVAVSSLECRVRGFATHTSIPGMDQVGDIVSTCTDDATQETASGDCPVASHSANVRDMLSNNAGTIGWIAVSFEYAIKHSWILRSFVATIVLIVGCLIGFCGYRFKDVEFWFEGLLAGMVIWSTIIAIIVCWFGVCRGGFISTCDPTWIFVIIMVLSVGCAFLSCKAQKIQMFVSGFDLGAMLGGIVYMIIYRCEVFDAFLDAEAARGIISGLLAATLGSGLLLGTLTVYFSKPVIVTATSAIGAVLIVFAIYMYFDFDLGWGHLVAMVIMTGACIAVQYLVTAKGMGPEKTSDKAENGDGDGDDNTALNAAAE